MEHRWGERVRVDVPVRLDAGPQSLALGFIRDASLSGAYVETSADLAPWTPVIVELRWGPIGEPHRIRAHVVRADKTGLALEWFEFAPELIRDLIAHAHRNRTSQRVATASATARVEATRVPPQSRDGGWASVSMPDTVGQA